MSKSSQKQVLLYIYDTMADFETSLAVFYINQSEKYEIKTCANEKNIVTAASGIKYKPDYTLDEIVDLENIAGILFPGGYEISCPDRLKTLLNNLNKLNKLIGAICAGPTYLALAGLLKNKKYTTTRTIQYYVDNPYLGDDPFPREGFQTQRLVRDSNIITAVGHAFVDFALEIWYFLEMFDNEDERAQWAKLFTPI